MIKTKKNIFRTFAVLCMTMLLTACSLGDLLGGATSESVAKKIQKSDESLSTFTSGPLALDSIISYYETNVSEANEIMKEIDLYDITPEEGEGVAATGEIAQFFLDNLEKSSSNDDKVNGAYLGTKNGTTVNGIFVYQFKDGVTITKEVADTANQISYKLGEYYVVSDKYIVTIDAQFVSGNGLNIEDLLEKIQTVLDKA